jgi:hypothetical protein
MISLAVAQQQRGDRVEVVGTENEIKLRSPHTIRRNWQPFINTGVMAIAAQTSKRCDPDFGN